MNIKIYARADQEDKESWKTCAKVPHLYEVPAWALRIEEKIQMQYTDMVMQIGKMKRPQESN